MQNNKPNSRIIAIIVFIALIIVALVVLKRDSDIKKASDKIIDQQEQKDTNREILGNKSDLVSFSILPNSTVKGVVSYKGSVKGAYFFEANILIGVTDANQKIIRQSHAMATTDWMTAEPVEFEGSLDFSGLPAGPAYIEIHNDNASGLPEHDKKILIPVVIEAQAATAVLGTKEYKNDKLGFSFSYPAAWGEVKQNISSNCCTDSTFEYQLSFDGNQIQLMGKSNPYNPGGRGGWSIDLTEEFLQDACDVSNNKKILTKNNVEGIFSHTQIAMYDTCSDLITQNIPKDYFAVFDLKTKIQNLVIVGDPSNISKEEFIKVVNSVVIK